MFGFKARQQAHSGLCNCWRNTEAEQKDQQDGIFFDRNRLNPHAKIAGFPANFIIRFDKTALVGIGSWQVLETANRADAAPGRLVAFFARRWT